MRRSLNSSAPSTTSSPLTRAQLQAAIESEERRQGLAPDSLVSETTVEEAAKKLGLSPDELRERALQAPSVAVKPTRAASPLWTPFSRKLFTFGIVLAVALTGLEGFSRLGVGKNLQAQRKTTQWSPTVYSSPKYSPIDARFKSLLAQTVGPNPTLRMIAYPNRGETNGREEEFFRIAGVPDGYDLYTFNNYASNIFGGGYSMNIGVVFRPFAEAPPKNEGALSPWRYVRLGDRWYARGWVHPKTLESKLSESGRSSYVASRDEVSPEPIQSSVEIVVPASGYASSNQEYLPSAFRPDAALLAATKKRGQFRLKLPDSLHGSEAQEGMRSSEFEFLSTGFSVSSNLVEVSQLTEGAPIRVPANMINLLQNGRKTYDNSRESVAIRRVDLRPEIKGDWTLVRYGEKLYLRGWIAGPVNKESLEGKNLFVSNIPDIPQMGYQPTKITLPLEHVSGIESGDGRATASFSQIALDEHAWEKW